MKQIFFIGLSILVVGLSYGCTKKQTASDGDSTDAEVAAQKNDSSNRKPFKFTIKTDIAHHDAYDDESSDESIDEPNDESNSATKFSENATVYESSGRQSWTAKYENG